MDPTPVLPSLPYGSISPEFENLLVATINKVDREWPSKWQAHQGAAYIVDSVARVTNNTHLSLRYLCADAPPRPERKVEFALSAIPVVRSLLDSVFLLVFLFEDLPARSSWYLKGGWREEAEELARYQAAYGGDPDWSEWLQEFAKMLDQVRGLAGVTPAEAANLKSLAYWPIPSGMLKSGKLSGDAQVFLQHLNDWFYRSFSSYAHLSLPGLIMRSAGLRPTTDDESERVRKWRVDKQRSDAVGMELVMCLSVMSEIEASCAFGLSTRLRYIWGVLNGFYGMSKELYRLRYDKLLA